jgi:hypothetical protein
MRKYSDILVIRRYLGYTLISGVYPEIGVHPYIGVYPDIGVYPEIRVYQTTGPASLL